jgi:type I restriction enzyme R subunit
MKFAESEVESAVLEWLQGLGYAILYGPDIAPGEPAAERADYGEVILSKRLRDALVRLNPTLPAEALEDAFRKVSRVDSPSLVQANRAFHRMLVDGVDVEYRADLPDGQGGGRIVHDKARLVDFENPDNNDWLAVNQFTVVEGQHNRRADVVLFLNGLPVAAIELKNPADENATVWTAFSQFQTYKHEVPSLFAFNEVLVISDGLEARMGSLTADREWFLPWRTIEGEQLAPTALPQLEVLIKGVFEPRRFLSFLHGFIVFEEDTGGVLTKKLAGYHQFHAVKVAVDETVRALARLPLGPDAIEDVGTYFARGPKGKRLGDRRIGVVWHTQGAGKSLTMAFYAGRIVLHPAMANPTLVVITDRNDLDDQLFGTFARCHELLALQRRL